MKASDDTEGKPRHLLVPRFHHARGKKGEPLEESKPEPKKGTQLVIVAPQKPVKKEVKSEAQKTPKVAAPVKKVTSSTAASSKVSTNASFQSASPATVPKGSSSSSQVQTKTHESKPAPTAF